VSHMVELVGAEFRGNHHKYSSLAAFSRFSDSVPDVL